MNYISEKTGFSLSLLSSYVVEVAVNAFRRSFLQGSGQISCLVVESMVEAQLFFQPLDFVVSASIANDVASCRKNI